jgi:Ca2+-binding RTX toxin-like protein
MSFFTGGADNDIFTGGADADTASGGAGADSLSGGGGGDTLSGGAGGDLIDGGDGDDLLFSGTAPDNFGYPYTNVTAVDPGVEVDTLMGGAGDDRLFAGYGDNVDGGANGSTGDYLFISFLGASSGVTVDFRLVTQVIGGGTITNVENISWVQGSNFDDDINVASYAANGYSNFTQVYGMGGNDTLKAGYYTGAMYGGDGDDVVDGRASQYLNIVEGGAGADTLYTNSNTFASAYGGDGDDTLYTHGTTYGGAGDDLIILQPTYYAGWVYGEAGDDDIRAASTGGHLSGGGGADILTGSILNDALYSGDAVYAANYGQMPADDMGLEFDQLFGLDGDDALAAGYGDDVDGGAGADTLRLSLGGLSSGITFSTAGIVTSQPYVLGGGTIQNVETLAYLRGTEFADTLTLVTQGTLLTIDAGAGDDVITSFNSSVAVSGGAGNDRFVSGAAGDTFDGGAGSDTIDYSSYATALSANLSTGVGAGGDTFTNVENIIGGSGDDTLTGAAGDNRLSGGAGADILDDSLGTNIYDGGAGDDQIRAGAARGVVDGGAGIDLLQISASGSSAVVADLASGVIKVGGVTTLSFSGIERLDATGSTAADTLTGGDLADTLSGGQGNDVLNGGLGADTLKGGAGNDYLFGEGNMTGVSPSLVGDDYILGEAGNDNIFGGGGNDYLSGGDGDDWIWTAGGQMQANGAVQTALGLADMGVDQIDGGAGRDMAVLYFDGPQSVSIDLNANLTTYTINVGGGAHGSLTGIEDLTVYSGYGNDTLAGGAGDDVLWGQGGDDLLIGNGGNDQLYGGSGLDRMVGGLGNDIYRIDDGNDVIEENAGEGSDMLWLENAFKTVFKLADYNSLENFFYQGSTGLTVTGVDAGSSIYTGAGADTLDGGAGADTLNGGDGADVLIGGGGTDNLSGGAGDDQIRVGSGRGVVDGGAGNDLLQVSALPGSSASMAADLASGVIKVAGATILSFSGIERLDATGSNAADTLTGGGGADVLDGGAGADILSGGGGDDTLVGGAGNDVMTGGAGNDAYEVANAGDVVIEAAGGGQDTVYAYVDGYVLAGQVETLVLGGGAYTGIGNALANVLIGNGYNNNLVGGSGNDVMAGGAGDDAYEVADVGDVVVENAGEGQDTVYAYVDGYVLAGQVETLVLGAGAYAGIGNAMANLLIGNGYSNNLVGGAGNDVMIGGAGNDAYEVTDAGDVVIENAGEGQDTVYAYVDGYVLADQVETLVLGAGAYTGIGNAMANVLIGNGYNNNLVGGAGADVMIGGAGNDAYEVTDAGDVVVENAGGGQDTVYAYVDGYVLSAQVETLVLGAGAYTGIGNAMANVLIGNGYDNILAGGAGADVMIGGAGNDAYEVTDAGDVVIENAGQGEDTVYAYVDNYVLPGQVETLVLGAGARAGSGNALANVLIGNSANNTLTGGGGADLFLFTTAAAGKDVVSDFTDGVDRVVIDHHLFADFAAIQVHAAQVGDAVVITYDSNTSLTLEHFALANLTASDFLFA